MRTYPEIRFQLQKPFHDRFRLVGAANHGKDCYLEGVERAEPRIDLHCPSEECCGVIEAPLTRANATQRKIGVEADRIERAKPQGSIRTIFGYCQIATKSMYVCTPIECGGTRRIERERAGNGCRGGIEIVAQMQDN
jgi:hypothetical protein